jgi:hypothetical protein
MSACFSPGRDALSKSPATTHGLVAYEWAASAKRGDLLCWLLSWPRKREVTRAPQAHESSRSESFGASEARTSKSIATEVAPTGGLLPALVRHSTASAIAGASELSAIQPAPPYCIEAWEELFDHAGSR